MVKSITLTASMRSNLNSLKNISKQMSTTQERLSTGKKVNSAIDNASSYYQARALTNRASDLDALLDAMGQGIQTIQAATQGLTSGVSFLEQASAIATEALAATKIPSKEWFASQENVAAVASNWTELKAALDSGVQGNIVIYGNIQAEGQIALGAGQNLVGVGYYGVEEPDTDKFSQLSIDFEKLNITDGIKAQADNLLISDISIKAATRKSVSSNIINFANTSNHILQNVDILMDNSMQDAYRPNLVRSVAIEGGNNINFYGMNSISEDKSSAINVHTVGISYSEVHLYGQLNINMVQGDSYGIGGAVLDVENGSILNIVSRQRGISSGISNFNGNAVVNIDAKQAFVYGTYNINDKSVVNIKAEYFSVSYKNEMIEYKTNLNINSVFAQVNLRVNRCFVNPGNSTTFTAISGSQIGINGKVYKADGAVNDNTMNGNAMPGGMIEIAGAVADPIPSLDWLKEQNANRNMDYKHKNDVEGSSNQYSEMLEQYDKLINDSSYQGVNLLKNEKLDVVFNETRNNKLTVQGKDMSSVALGLTKAEWTTQGDIANSIQELLTAVNKIRTFQSELGNNYSIIQTRQNFTEALTDVLETGADNLVLADMNEESANYLALQTRQQLATNALSLAANSAQSVLALFG